MGADLGPGCPDPEDDTDGSTGGGDEAGTAGGVDDAGVDVTGGATEGTSGMPGVDEGGGCGCRAQPRTLPLLGLLALAWARRRRR
jgi:hypothetical protein